MNIFAPSLGRKREALSVSATAASCELQPVAATTSSNGMNARPRKAGEAMTLCFLRKCALTGLISLFPAAVAFGQSTPEPVISANDLARAVVANELTVQDGNHSRWMYRLDREEQGKKNAKEVVQTRQGSLDRLVAVD